MNPNTHYPNYDAPDAYGDNSASPDSLILYFSLKLKIDPKSMLKLKINKLQWLIPTMSQMTPPPMHPMLSLP